ncbi:Phospholipase D alpha 1 [Platanthera zijinensis]|uniref:Phospholipase D n=1 Tax=Platanthera zijinensis TaxID=2320716 RepID=A0AAP0BS86_9ASPA
MKNTEAKGKMILLHGILHVDILEADGVQSLLELANAATKFNRWKRFARRCSWLKRVSSWFPSVVAGDIEKTAGLTVAPPAKLYATVDLKNARVGRTRVISTGERSDPSWNESFRIYCAHMSDHVIFTVKSDNPIGATLLGRAYLPASSLLSGSLVDASLDICDEQRRPLTGRIHVRARYEAVAGEAGGWGSGVPNTFFKQTEGCRVTLYHDADVDPSFAPRIRLAGGEFYRPGRCWEDVFEAISGAKHLVYVAGWSVYAEVALLRGGGGEITLGEVLKRKAGEGVRVLMLVWDDRSSVGELKKDGVMATHDQDTAAYFRGSGVHCVLCPRNPDIGESYVQGFEIATLFTHHQKTVIADCAAAMDAAADRRKGGRKEAARRRIVSFLGGIDLCDGRYDTQRHSLFQTLAGEHRDDFHQPNFTGATLRKGGPREPWHDVHCRIEGPAAWDVLLNFEQRWMKQGTGENLLLRLRDVRSVVPPEEDAAAPGDGSSWNVQVFRSIDGGAAHGFPESPAEAAAMGLVSGKDGVVERSIQDAYINAIRRAKNFIYIENQYFLGSSYAWKEERGIKVDDIGALHLIPKELALKIASKIEAGERFAVYVVMPMWPEGVPESGSVQAILNWQRRTMEMMYGDVSAALMAKGIAGDYLNPRDYLNFFCLGNREEKRGGEYEPPETPERGSDYSRAQQARRFMIYVHSKMMIVDDEYIIVGSANINQRSMDGGRDTEIAMGAYQPHHLSSAQPARGQIHGFRLSLWHEHLGTADDDAFLRPESRECVLKVRENAERRWQLYLRPRLDNDLPGHLLSYPISVDAYGRITTPPELGLFPDTRAPVLGTRSDRLPAILTT